MVRIVVVCILTSFSFVDVPDVAEELPASFRLEGESSSFLRNVSKQ
jgi:hypothetical protein